MKLAEALVERKAAQTKLSELSGRLDRSILVQEGMTPLENPTDLLNELEETARRLERLIVAINQTNLATLLEDGRSITEAIAQRDVLRMRINVIDNVLRQAGNVNFRSRGSEIRMLVTIDVAQLQRGRDTLARQLRELDAAIQAANWATELLAGIEL